LGSRFCAQERTAITLLGLDSKIFRRKFWSGHQLVCFLVLEKHDSAVQVSSSLKLSEPKASTQAKKQWKDLVTGFFLLKKPAARLAPSRSGFQVLSLKKK
jgi:hypothetical protein